MQQMVQEQKFSVDPPYPKAKEELEQYVEQVRVFMQKPGVVYDGSLKEFIGPNGGHVHAGFNYDHDSRNFRLQLLIYPNREENKRNGVRYERRIILPGGKSEWKVEPEEFLIASQIFPMAYHLADALGIRANIGYDHWRLDLHHRVSICLSGIFDKSKWTGVLDLVKKVDDLIDANTSSEH